MARTQVLIATPLEAELAARIREAEPRADVLYELDLLPPARYPADHRGDPAFRRDAGAESRWRALLGQAEVLFGIPDDSAEGLAEAVRDLPRLRWVHAMSAGAGEVVRQVGLPPEALERVVITTSSGVHAAPLAEYSILGLLAVAKELPQFVEDQRKRAWPEVRRPLREQTTGLVDRATIERLPASCIFVNVGRGGVVDEPALIDALRERRIAGAVLDVFATEPLPEDSPLWTLPNVILTPHAGALSLRENERIVELFVDNLRRYLDGRPLRKVVEPGVYY
ncbi:MAG TPA: NAD(P)-dependent oxidoreductase [Actinomycetes bacterium]|nr:NAD(P)-dependent oxidoreductase [Actinomycetes bacterium]